MPSPSGPGPAAEATARTRLPDRPDVFVSYSRRDKTFVADSLLPALTGRDRDVWVDTEDIPPAADWRATVLEGIAKAHAFVFVLSPDSLGSPICAEELRRAVALNKRLVPILRREVAHDDVPEDLERPNWIFLRDEDQFEAGFDKLTEALDTDLEWRQMQTRIAVRSVEWEREGRDRSFLLRGRDLESAERWLAEQGSHRERATPEQAEYILRGRRAASRRQRTTLAAVASALVIALALAAVAFWQRQEAERQARQASSRELAATSLAMVERDPELSVLLATEASAKAPTGQAEDALRQAILRWPAKRAIPHPAEVEGAEYSPDGRLFVTAAGEEARLFDAATGRVIRRFPVGSGGVLSARFSPDGRQILTATPTEARAFEAASGRTGAPLSQRGDLVRGARYSGDGRRVIVATLEGARVLDARTGRVIATLDDPAITFDAELSARGELAVTSGPTTTARVWRVATGRQVAVLRHRSVVTGATLSPDGRHVVTGALNTPATVWSLPDGGRVATIGTNSTVDNPGSFSPDGRYLFVPSSILGEVWDTRTRRTVARLRHDSPLVTSAFSRDGRRLVTGDVEGVARVWDAERGRILNTLSRHGASVTSAAFSPDGRFVLTASPDRSARIWEAVPRSSALELRRGDETFQEAKLSPDGRTVAAASDAGVVRLWSSVTGELEASLTGPGGVLDNVAFSRDGRLLISGGEGGTARIWRVAERRPLATLKGHTALILDVSLSPDGRYALTTSNDGTIRLWDAPTGRMVRRLGPFSEFRLVGGAEFALAGRRIAADIETGVGLAESPSARELGAFPDSNLAGVSPDGGTLAIGGVGGVTLRRANDGKQLRRLASGDAAGAPDGVFGVAFDPDGRLLAGVGASGAGYAWDLRSGRRLVRIRQPPLFALSIAPGGAFMAAGHDDGLVRVFELPSGEGVATLGDGGRRQVRAVEWSADGGSLLAVRKDGGASVYFCEVCRSQAELVRLARGRAIRPLSADERRTYLHE